MSPDETTAADGSTDTDDQQHPRETCYFCDGSDDLETHHVFPRRCGGGGDAPAKTEFIRTVIFREAPSFIRLTTVKLS